ncbi:ROK family protein [Sphingomonas sp. XXL09]|uniref:ROK family protein n=1 Tax=Sphingomonas sp. XXL09 TaxID=3457787 RepID=UPI00406BB63A
MPRPAILLSEAAKRLLLELRTGGPASRSRIAARLDIGHATVTRLSRELITLGLIAEQEEPATRTGRGRPMVPLVLSGEGGYAVGATVHPGWAEIVALDCAGRLLAREEVPFDDPDPRAFARLLEAQLRAIAGRPGILPYRFLGLGIASTGYVVDAAADRRWTVEWVAGWRDVPQARFFSDALGLPVWVENDGTVAALAEYYRPAIITRYRDILVFFLGHGLGGGVIADRRLVRGEHGNAGEVGRLFLDPAARPSGLDLLHTLRRAGIAIHSLSDLPALLDDHAPLFAGWMDRVAGQLRYGIEAGAAWLDPGAVVISGTLPDALLTGLAERLRGWTTPGYHGAAPAIHASPLGSTAVAIGAAMLPIHALTA